MSIFLHNLNGPSTIDLILVIRSLFVCLFRRWYPDRSIYMLSEICTRLSMCTLLYHVSRFKYGSYDTFVLISYSSMTLLGLSLTLLYSPTERIPQLKKFHSVFLIYSIYFSFYSIRLISFSILFSVPPFFVLPHLFLMGYLSCHKDSVFLVPSFSDVLVRIHHLQLG